MKWPPRYAWVPILGIFGPLTLEMLLAAIDFDFLRDRISHSPYIEYVIGLLHGTMVAGFLWFTWVHPFFAVNDESLARHKQVPRLNRDLTMLPTWLAGIGMILTVIPGAALAYALMRWHDSEVQVALATAFFVSLVATNIVVVGAWLLRKRVRAMLERNAARWRLCFKCGYDLRGGAENAPCPECGYLPVSRQ